MHASCSQQPLPTDLRQTEPFIKPVPSLRPTGKNVLMERMSFFTRIKYVEKFQSSYIVYNQSKIGRIKEVIALDLKKPRASHIALQVFKFLPALHPTLHVPCLELTNECVVVEPKVCPSMAMLHLS